MRCILITGLLSVVSLVTPPVLIGATADSVPDAGQPERSSQIAIEQINTLTQEIERQQQRYHRLMQESEDFAQQAEELRQKNHQDHYKIWNLAERKKEEAELTQEEIDILILKRVFLYSEMEREVEQQITLLMTQAKEMRKQEEELKKKMSKTKQDSGDYQQLKSQLDENIRQNEEVRKELANLELQKKFLLLEQGNPDDEADSPYQP